MDVDDFLLAVDGHGASDIVADGIMQHKGLWQKAQNQCSSPGFHLQQAQQRPRLSAHVNTKFLKNPVLLGFGIYCTLEQSEEALEMEVSYKTGWGKPAWDIPAILGSRDWLETAPVSKCLTE